MPGSGSGGGARGAGVADPGPGPPAGRGRGGLRAPGRGAGVQPGGLCQLGGGGGGGLPARAGADLRGRHPHQAHTVQVACPVPLLPALHHCAGGGTVAWRGTPPSAGRAASLAPRWSATLLALRTASCPPGPAGAPVPPRTAAPPPAPASLCASGTGPWWAWRGRGGGPAHRLPRWWRWEPAPPPPALASGSPGRLRYSPAIIFYL